MLYWMVIFPCGDRGRLDIAQVRSYEKSDWALASRREFDSERECRDYMLELAEKHDLGYPGKQSYLD